MPGFQIKTPVANGSWSNPATWEGSVLPSIGDYISANGFTVNIDQNVDVARLSTTSLTNNGATEYMTSNTTPAGYIVSASIAHPTQPAYFAFNSDTGDPWWTNTTTLPQWISYQFPTPIIINRYAFLGASFTLGRTANNWTFQGSNDGVNWITLETKTSSAPAIGSYYTSPLLGNTTAYSIYRINVTAVQSAGNSLEFRNIRLYNTSAATTSSVAGGGFTLSGSYIVTASLETGTTTCLTFTGPSSVTASIVGNVTSGDNPAAGIVHNGSGSLTVRGNINAPSQNNSSNFGCRFTGPGIFNIVGNLISNSSGAWVLISSGIGSTLNIVGNLYTTTSGNSTGVLIVTANNTTNITGNIVNRMDINTAWTVVGIQANTICTINLTGNIIVGRNSTPPLTYGITSNSAMRLNITGDIVCDRYESGIAATSGGVGVNLTGVSYLNHIGIIRAGRVVGGVVPQGVSSTAGSSINLMSGPFVCGEYGITPIYVPRMHLIPTLNNYFEFRDDSTNGALFPGAIAPATRLVSPDTIIDAPTANNVRLGVSYGNGAYTGTCAIPSASNVALNVQFDTGSVGTAFISANDITNQVWGSLTANLTGSNTIGERLKNASTVSTTGAQIASL